MARPLRPGDLPRFVFAVGDPRAELAGQALRFDGPERENQALRALRMDDALGGDNLGEQIRAYLRIRDEGAAEGVKDDASALKQTKPQGRPRKLTPQALDAHRREFRDISENRRAQMLGVSPRTLRRVETERLAEDDTT